MLSWLALGRCIVFGGHDVLARLGQQGELRTRRGEDTEVGGLCSSYVRDHLRCTRPVVPSF